VRALDKEHLDTLSAQSGPRWGRLRSGNAIEVTEAQAKSHQYRASTAPRGTKLAPRSRRAIPRLPTMPDVADKPAMPGRPIKLSRWQRVGAVLSGAGFAGAGGWAEIASGHDGAGTVAFVAAGALLAGLGIIGRMPNRISGKEYKAEFDDLVEERATEKAEEAIADVIEGLPTEAKKEIAKDDSELDVFTSRMLELLEKSRSASEELRQISVRRLRNQAAHTASESLSFETYMSRRIVPIIERLGLETLSDDHVVDLKARSRNGAVLLVEFKNSSQEGFLRSVFRLEDLLRVEPSGSRGLVVVAHGISLKNAKIVTANYPHILILGAMQSDESIENSIRRLMAL
jgi:hypothetical protein